MWNKLLPCVFLDIFDLQCFKKHMWRYFLWECITPLNYTQANVFHIFSKSCGVFSRYSIIQKVMYVLLIIRIQLP